MAQKLAPYDTQSAKSLLNKMKYKDSKPQAYVEISKHQNDLDAQATLNEAKECLGASFSTEFLIPYFTIYQEEQRGNLPESQETFNFLLEKLDQIHKSQMHRFYNGGFVGEFSLLKLLDCEALLESPLFAETLKVLWECSRQVIPEHIQNGLGEDYSKVQFISSCCRILIVESTHSFLRGCPTFS